MACVSYQGKPLQTLVPLASGLRTNITCRYSRFRKTYRHFCSKNGSDLSPKMLYGLGDVIAQKISSPKSKLDRHRILRGIVYGSIINAPLGHLHFNFLEWLVVKKVAVRSTLVPFVKVFIDQFVYWAPTVVFLYHVSMGVMEGLSYDQCGQRLKQLYWPTLQANWMIWFPMQIINFKFIPVAHQLNYCLVVGMFWSTLLSYIRSREKDQDMLTDEDTFYKEMEVHHDK